MELILIFLIVYTLICCLVGNAAKSKGRNGFGFFLVSFLLSPILGAIIVLVMQKQSENNGEERVDNSHQDMMDRQCPFCAEIIKREAILCRYCGKDLPKLETIQVQEKSVEPAWQWNESFLEKK